MPRFVFVCAFLIASSAAADKSAVAVLDIQGTGVEANLLPTLTEVLTVEIDNLAVYKVVAGRDVQSMLGFEKQKDMLGCTDAACLAEIGGALGVDRIVASHIGKVGDTFVINIKLINIRMADTEARVYETVEGKVDKLIDTVRRSVVKLLGPGSRAATALGLNKAPAAVAPPAVSPTSQQSSVAAAPLSEPAPPIDAPAATIAATSGGGGIGWLPITLWSAGGAMLAGSLVAGLRAKALEGDSQSQEDPDAGIYSVGAQAAGEKAKNAAVWSNILLLAGVVTGGSGLLVWLLSGDDEAAAAVAPMLGPDGVGVAFSGSF